LALQLSDRLWLMEESRFSIGTPKELAADGSLSRFINRDGIRFNKDSIRIEIK
jgi:iron complex transport system ATP-binding protein